jgi:hypothetical protein
VVVLSIGGASVFWLFTALNKPNNTTVGYPVTWQFDTEKYIVVDELPTRIRMNVDGIGWNLLRASLGYRVTPVTIVLNNPAANKKISGVSLTNRVKDQLEDIDLNYILDDTLLVNIDRKGSRSFAVYVDSSNISLEKNFRIVSPIKCDTDILEIEGPLSMLNSIPSDSFLLAITEQQIDTDFDEEIDFSIERPELFLFRPKSAHVAFAVAEFVEAERQVVLQRLNFPEDDKAYLNDSLCTVQFLIRKDLEATIVADSFTVIADYLMVNKLDSTLLLNLENSPPQALDVRLALPQVRVNYNE